MFLSFEGYVISHDVSNVNVDIERSLKPLGLSLTCHNRHFMTHLHRYCTGECFHLPPATFHELPNIIVIQNFKPDCQTKVSDQGVIWTKLIALGTKIQLFNDDRLSQRHLCSYCF